VLTGASFVVEVSTPRLPRDITAAEAPPAASSHQDGDGCPVELG
jgi:hypothetical protein